jgi:hypothetical protein
MMWNLLSLDGNTLDIHAEKPWKSIRRLSLLSEVRMQASAEIHGTMSKRPTYRVSYLPTDVEACLSSWLVAEPDSVSPYHVDVLDGTAIETYLGFKVWFAHLSQLSQSDMDTFAIDGPTWKPRVGKDGIQMIPAVPGSVPYTIPGGLIRRTLLLRLS